MAKKQHTTVPEIRLSRRIPVNPGDRFGRLTIVKEVEPYVSPSGKSIERQVECVCDCGEKTTLNYRSLRSGHTQSCGCLNKERTAEIRAIPIDTLIGKKFNGLTILSEGARQTAKKGFPKRMMNVVCACGVKKVVGLGQLTSGNTKSCGCSREGHGTHGLSGTPIHKVWKQMNTRCHSQSNPAYKDYGGRGISICKEWVDFQVFYDWAIENGWRKGLIFDREDVDGGYEPGNCRFVDRGISNRNTRLLSANNTSGYRGITRQTSGRWYATIRYENERIHLGTFDTKIEAAHAYDKMAKSLDPNYPLNFPEGA